ncbi:FAD-binding oxidoreductase [Aspergillus novofumigatus IBT 16806]|uniref:Putative oxidoreductase n=1 Tax=Aspergillus novofumigatus (strain IBT 16806) TaxID=1392255 RepID=A0A2I1CNT4_ASPN1|nr:putative oxidoreductase [Aspergillus novofumigatus IBT 16806]PKX99265.1 putative oxidoreductase [Aspergillus novofumigatus IBT 16806]
MEINQLPIVSDNATNPVVDSTSAMGICCLALSTILGDKPLCIVSPSSVEELSTAITTITNSNCQFAIRSGGHTSFGGACNIANGITIDLRALNSITVSDDRTTVSVGVGASWGDVYAFLDPLGLSVAGGRAAQVGVGGLTIGGGISYFSPRYGWTCDTVTNFEVVLANGTVVQANENENTDLLVALRGGAANFGIVTRVDFRAFEQGPIWGGTVYCALDTIDEQLRVFADLNSAEGYDEHASLITSFGFAKGKGAAVVNSVVYTKAEERPAVFEPIMKIPSMFSTMRLASMHEMSLEQGSFAPNGKRQLSAVTTHASTVPMLNATYLRWSSSLAAIEDVPGIASGSLVITLLSATWEDEADDAKVEQAARALFAGIEDDARKLDGHEPYVYLNYAAEWQDPIASYGKASIEKLQQVSQAVDPKGVFRNKMPGGFKIPTSS